MNRLHNRASDSRRGEPVTQERVAASPEPAQYQVDDAAGRPIGTITAPVERPTLGPRAPTFYLRREGPRRS
jgi:hypothetical protein